MGNNLSDQEKKTDSIKFIEVSDLYQTFNKVILFNLINLL